MIRYILQHRELIIGLSCVYFIQNIIRTWNQYSSCYAPIQLFILETFSLILAQRTFSHLRHMPCISQSVRKNINYFLYFAVNPAFVTVTIHGLVCQIVNGAVSPDCAAHSISGRIWLLIAALFVIDGVVVTIIVGNVLAWRKFRAIRRRQEEEINEIQIIDEYLGSGLERMFLSGNLVDDTDEPTTLTYEDIQKIPRELYSEEQNGARQAFEEACPVCFEDFKGGEEVCTLPSCKHIFHWKCIDGWFKISVLCPMCRTNVKDSLSYPTTRGGSEFGDLHSDDVESLVSQRG